MEKAAKKNWQEARDLAKIHGRLTAGVLVKEGCYQLTESLMKVVRCRKNAQTVKVDKPFTRKYDLLKKYYDNGLGLQQSKKPEAKWMSPDFVSMIWFKQLGRIGVPSIPKTVGDHKT